MDWTWLEGRELRTLCAKAPFCVLKVKDYLLLKTSTGNPRRVPSSSLDRALMVLKTSGEITGVYMRDEINAVDVPYLASILAEVPGVVSLSTRKIHLRLDAG